jgi:uncharacterized protein (DUF1810 family)
MSDTYDLHRFVDAQEHVYADVLEELRQGRKRSHWMWFIFPQIAGLGHSAMAQTYAIGSIDEARAYLAHPLLGARLRECCRLTLNNKGRSVEEIFGYPDHMKFHSSVTLFAHAAGKEEVFDACLAEFFGGTPDRNTLALLPPA